VKTCKSSFPLVMAALALAACASWPPGEDPRGQELRAQATPVLHALARYHKDKGEYPRSLHELVPRYLRDVPFAPGLRFDRDYQAIEFTYSPSWPQTRDVTCTARFGELDWVCRPGA
jgi:hypothetical protein